MFYLYILLCKDNTLYTGITNDVDKRMQVHKFGKGSKYVKARLPFKLVYTEEFPDRSTASKRENHIKSLTREEKLALISK